MGKQYESNYDFSFIDNGMTIPNSFKKNNIKFNKDSKAIIKAINGLSTKNEFGYIERGTGLNNTTNIVTNGDNGSILIVSGCGLVYITKDNILTRE